LDRAGAGPACRRGTEQGNSPCLRPARAAPRPCAAGRRKGRPARADGEGGRMGNGGRTGQGRVARGSGRAAFLRSRQRAGPVPCGKRGRGAAVRCSTSSARPRPPCAPLTPAMPPSRLRSPAAPHPKASAGFLRAPHTRTHTHTRTRKRTTHTHTRTNTHYTPTLPAHPAAPAGRGGDQRAARGGGRGAAQVQRRKGGGGAHAGERPPHARGRRAGAPPDPGEACGERPGEAVWAWGAGRGGPAGRARLVAAVRYHMQSHTQSQSHEPHARPRRPPNALARRINTARQTTPLTNPPGRHGHAGRAHVLHYGRPRRRRRRARRAAAQARAPPAWNRPPSARPLVPRRAGRRVESASHHT
jgi:hypothetical protein